MHSLMFRTRLGAWILSFFFPSYLYLNNKKKNDKQMTKRNIEFFVKKSNAILEKEKK